MPGQITLSRRQIFPLRFNASILPHKHRIKARRLQGKTRMLNVVAASRKPLPCDSLRPSCLTRKLTLSQQLTKICKPNPTYSTGARVNNGFAALCCHKHFRLPWRSPTKKPWKRVTSFKSRKQERRAHGGFCLSKLASRNSKRHFRAPPSEAKERRQGGPKGVSRANNWRSYSLARRPTESLQPGPSLGYNAGLMSRY